ncbi:MAG: hypothetical protein K8R48_03100 [Alphaproteobacteria bacterium]|nr:hypothetical protein [Alphaproteobacteria bacterium]
MDDMTRDTLAGITACLKQWRDEHEAVFGEIPDRDFCQPPVDFEKKYSLTGVSQRYRLPEGLSPRDLQNYALLSWRKESLTVAEQQERLAGVWHLLTAYNPELNKVLHDPQDTDTLFHAIMGVASAFNIEDIQGFISSATQPHRAWEMEKTSEFIKLTEVFNHYAIPDRLNLRWVASPVTLRSIRDKIIRKYRCGF